MKRREAARGLYEVRGGRARQRGGVRARGRGEGVLVRLLAGTNLLETLTMPNGMTLTQSYEEKRDLPAEMTYRRGTTGVVIRNCAYDTLGRPLTRKPARQGGTREDTFTHNGRSELTEAVLGSDDYAYACDCMGRSCTKKVTAK
ncbi:MAG: hypothetical protein LUG84_06545 [Akkermansiaceae bacterium]|nr:hypothetical protein [Akkermansiaceae bacterium]